MVLSLSLFDFQLEEMGLEKVTFSMVCGLHLQSLVSLNLSIVAKSKPFCPPLAIQFVLSDEFSHLRPEQRLALLHVSMMSNFTTR